MLMSDVSQDDEGSDEKKRKPRVIFDNGLAKKKEAGKELERNSLIPLFSSFGRE